MADTNFTFEIAGQNIAGLVAINGYKWGVNDLHSEKSGRTMDGYMHVYRIASKVQLDISCIPMSEEEARTVLSALKSTPEFTVTYEDPEYSSPRTATFYCASRNCEFLMACRGVKWWQNLKFTLTEC